MKRSTRWLLHKNKRPYYVSGKPRSGKLDSQRDIAQLATYHEATAVLAKSGGNFDGLGFALGPDGNGGFWQGIDFDKVDENQLSDLVNLLPGYVEVSPSGKGAHAIGYGPEFRTLGSNGCGIEAYPGGRFFTVSKNIIRDGSLADLSSFVETQLKPIHKLKNRSSTNLDKSVTIDIHTLGELENALKFLDADNYQTWIDVGLALKTTGDQGKQFWLKWSANSPKFNEAEAMKKWESFQPDHTNYQSIFSKAKQSGWNRKNIKLRFNILRGSDLTSQPPMQWRVKGVLPKHGIAAIYGASGDGKSFLAFDLACALAGGINWFGSHVKQSPVLYIGLEGEAGFRARAMAWEHKNGCSIPEDLRFLLEPFQLNRSEDVSQLASLCPPGCVVIIDTLNRSAPGADENSSKDIGAVIEGAKRLQELINSLVILISHTGKDKSKGLRGHSSLFAAMDAVVYVNRDNTERSWKLEKSKDGRDGSEHRFKLEVMTVGKDEDGDDETSCVIEPIASPIGKQVKRLNPTQELGMSTFRTAAALYGKLDNEHNFLGLHSNDWRQEYYRKSPADTDDAKRKAFSRVRKFLVEENLLSVTNDVYRIAGFNAKVQNDLIAQQIKGEQDNATGQRQIQDVSEDVIPEIGTGQDTSLRGVPCPKDHEVINSSVVPNSTNAKPQSLPPTSRRS